MFCKIEGCVNGGRIKLGFKDDGESAGGDWTRITPICKNTKTFNGSKF